MDIIAMGEELCRKVPALPSDTRGNIVIVTPWIALLLGIARLAFGIFLLVLSPIFISGEYRVGHLLVATLFSIVASIVMLLSYPGTKNNQYRGWKLLFWSGFISLIGSVMNLSPIGIFLQVVIFYFLYQIKPYYK